MARYETIPERNRSPNTTMFLIAFAVIVGVGAYVYVHTNGGRKEASNEAASVQSANNSPGTTQVNGSGNVIGNNFGNQAGGNAAVTNNYQGASEVDTVIQDAQAERVGPNRKQEMDVSGKYYGFDK